MPYVSRIVAIPTIEYVRGSTLGADGRTISRSRAGGIPLRVSAPSRSVLGYAHAHLAAGQVVLGTAHTRRAPDPMGRPALGGGASRLAVVLTGTKLVPRVGAVKPQGAREGNSLITGRTAQKWPPERRKGRGSR